MVVAIACPIVHQSCGLSGETVLLLDRRRVRDLQQGLARGYWLPLMVYLWSR
jgi:hypothetical protein